VLVEEVPEIFLEVLEVVVEVVMELEPLLL
jgi:hypothetical protein